MMTYLGGLPVTLTIPLIDSIGLGISTQSVSYRITDQSESELVAKVALDTFTEGEDSAVVVIPGDVNTLGADETRGLRVVELYLTTESGTVKIEESYFVEANVVLVECVNSFQGYSKANYVSYEIPNLPGWNEAGKQERIAALIAARRNIGQLRFRYIYDGYQDIIDNTVGVSDLTLVTASQWAALPDDFKAAICRAQVIEADNLLGGDEIGDLRRAGLLSKTVGESKQFFRTAKAVEGVVCKRAMKELAKFVLTRTRISRG